ncbi:thioredoxin family protein [Candidatus Woesearchaeota archaeon]|nr:thioredoxin family protein [Candidatus Woesearchaeota archaeon]
MINIRLKARESAPDFNLPGVDGRSYSLEDFGDKKILVVFFTCNHCPYARAYEDRLMKLQEDFKEQVQFVGINSNDAVNYPEDSLDNMKIRATERGFNFPYLRDKSQTIAQEYGGEVTPDCFVFNEKRKLVYSGRIDDNWQDPSDVTTKDLRKAIQAVLDSEDIAEQELRAIGCSIKWK